MENKDLAQGYIQLVKEISQQRHPSNIRRQLDCRILLLREHIALDFLQGEYRSLIEQEIFRIVS